MSFDCTGVTETLGFVPEDGCTLENACALSIGVVVLIPEISLIPDIWAPAAVDQFSVTDGVVATVILAAT